MLEIKDLDVKLKETDKTILKRINLTFDLGEVTYILGPNGAGKSVLLHTVMGSPLYKVTSGDILLDNESILRLPPEGRAKLGLFLTWQEPLAIPGSKTKDYLFYIWKEKHAPEAKDEEVEGEFNNSLYRYVESLELPANLLERDLFVGFSGGEKKRLEILAMFLLKPKYVFLDELDSGLDISSERFIFAKIKEYIQNNEVSLTIVSHTFRVADYIPPDKTVVIKNGRITAQGGQDLFEEVKDKGFED